MDNEQLFHMVDFFLNLDIFFGAVAIMIFCLFQCAHLYVCRLCLNFQDLCTSLLGDIPPFFMLTPISCFMIDFLSIEKANFSPLSPPMILTP